MKTRLVLLHSVVGLCLGFAGAASVVACGPAKVTAATNPSSCFAPVPEIQQTKINVIDPVITKTDGSPGFQLSLKPEDLDRSVRDHLDLLAEQKDSAWSRLRWRTNFASARAEARREHKPILSLRLLGRLVDDISCANSRYFRTALYANTQVSDYLRDHYILHWQSVGPVPRVSVDFADGRSLERTITGNSVHYILDEDGQPVDALPGLYGPGAFLQGLQAGLAAVKQIEAAQGAARIRLVREYHLLAAVTSEAELSKNLRRAGVAPSTNSLAAGANPFTAGRLAISKMRVESSLLHTVLAANSGTEEIPPSTWEAVARLRANDCQLDASSISLMHFKTGFSDEKLNQMVDAFQRSMSLDTVRNEYLFHDRIHRWFANAEVTGLESLNQRVYAELFLTPLSDPWFGLRPDDAYAALDETGTTERPAPALADSSRALQQAH